MIDLLKTVSCDKKKSAEALFLSVSVILGLLTHLLLDKVTDSRWTSSFNFSVLYGFKSSFLISLIFCTDREGDNAVATINTYNLTFNAVTNV